MLAWMHHRGHSWKEGMEMTVAMLTPMFALVIPVEVSVAKYVPGLSEQSHIMLSHVAMIAGMVVLMVYRQDRYAHGAHGHRPERRSATLRRYVADVFGDRSAHTNTRRR
jgi:hypothetical protein